jgi:hypothetical protein
VYKPPCIGVIIKNKMSAVMYTDSTLVGASYVYEKTLFDIQDTIKIINKEIIRSITPYGNKPNEDKIRLDTKKKIRT